MNVILRQNFVLDTDDVNKSPLYFLLQGKICLVLFHGFCFFVLRHLCPVRTRSKWVILFLRRQNLRFAGKDLVIFQGLELVTGQQDWLVKFVADHIAILARQCPLTGSYFEPCKSSWKLMSLFNWIKKHSFCSIVSWISSWIKALHSTFKIVVLLYCVASLRWIATFFLYSFLVIAWRT